MKKMMILSLGFVAGMTGSMLAMEKEEGFGNITLDLDDNTPTENKVGQNTNPLFYGYSGEDKKIGTKIENENLEQETDDFFKINSFVGLVPNFSMSFTSKVKLVVALIGLGVVGKYAFFNQYDLGIQSRIIDLLGKGATGLVDVIRNSVK